MSEMQHGRLFFYIGGPVGFGVLAVALLVGYRWHRARIAVSTDPLWLRRFEQLVANGMLIGACLLGCMICLVLLSLLAE